MAIGKTVAMSIEENGVIEPNMVKRELIKTSTAPDIPSIESFLGTSSVLKKT
jgi:hypothetical protein